MNVFFDPNEAEIDDLVYANVFPSRLYDEGKTVFCPIVDRTPFSFDEFDDEPISIRPMKRKIFIPVIAIEITTRTKFRAYRRVS